MYQIDHYVTAAGSDWIDGLRDQRAVAKVLTRIDRLALGNFGDYRALDGGSLNCELILGRDIGCMPRAWQRWSCSCSAAVTRNRN